MIEWILCEEELPETGDSYLVSWLPKNEVMKENRKGKCFIALCEWVEEDAGNVGHWQVNDISVAKYYGGAEIIAWADVDPYELEE